MTIEPANGGNGGDDGPRDNIRLDNIIGNYNTATDRDPVDYPQNRFPQEQFPDGRNPDAFNPEPFNIATRQTRPTEDNRNPINADDVALRTASERHPNAVKGITNLLKIIDQARANQLKAESDIEVFTKAYNDALGVQRTAQNNIIAAETKSTQIGSAINGLNSTIDDLRRRIDEAVQRREELQTRKDELVNIVTTQETQKANLLEDLADTNQDLSDTMKELSDKRVECQGIQNQVDDKTAELQAAQDELLQANQDKATAEADVADRQALVDDLRQQLADAENNLTDAKIRLAEIQALIDSLPAQIEILQGQLDDLRAASDACQEELAALQALLERLRDQEVADLTDQIDALENSILENRQEINNIDSQLANSIGPLEDLRAKLAKAEDDLAYLKVQQTAAQEALRQAYVAGNDANTQVAHAKDNINAISDRLAQESRIASEATLNLEKARAEEKLARLRMEELIAHYSDALPYSIVPNGNGATNPGAPFGNNPSGSALGEVAQNTNGAPGAFQIDSWTHYLSNAFGAGVHPAHARSVNELFPFNYLSDAEGNVVVNGYTGLRGGCGPAVGPQRSFEGEVVAVRAHDFDVRTTDGAIINVAVDHCTKLNADKPSYQMIVGDFAYVKGGNKGHNKVHAGQVTCLG